MNRFDSARYGRFMSMDPLLGRLAAPQSLNRYAYAGNDPVNRVDPTGLRETPSCRISLDVGCGGFDGSGVFVDGVELPNFSGLGGDLVDAGAAIDETLTVTTTYDEVSYSESVVGHSIDGEPSPPTDRTNVEITEYTETTYLPSFQVGGYSRSNDTSKQPWETRGLVLKVLKGKNPCSDWFNAGKSFESAVHIMSTVPILRYKGPENEGARTDSDPHTAIEVNDDGMFYGDDCIHCPIRLVGGSFIAGSDGAKILILLHELAHKVQPEGFTSDGGFTDPPDASEKNTQRVIQHCADTINKQ